MNSRHKSYIDESSMSKCTSDDKEKQHLDIIFSILHPDILKSVSREDVTTFNQLLLKVRNLKVNQTKKTPRNRVDNASIKKKQKKRIRCRYCRKHNHTVNECRKKQIDKLQNSDRENAGVSNSQHPEFNASKPPVFGFSPFNPLQSPLQLERPALRILVQGNEETAYVDTGSNLNVASYQLHKILAQQGCPSTFINSTVTLADGIKKEQMIFVYKVHVHLLDRLIPTTFAVLPDATASKTLLGIEFLYNADLVLSLKLNAWYFRDRPDRCHLFAKMDEPSLPDVSSGRVKVEGPSSETEQEEMDLDLIRNEYNIPPLLSPLHTPMEVCEEFENLGPISSDIKELPGYNIEFSEILMKSAVSEIENYVEPPVSEPLLTLKKREQLKHLGLAMINIQLRDDVSNYQDCCKEEPFSDIS